MIMLSAQEQSTLKEIVKSQFDHATYRVVVFGSRANGRAKKYSDLDLALIGQEPLSVSKLASLNEAFDGSSLPYTVDIVDFAKASPALQAQITERGTEVLIDEA